MNTEISAGGIIVCDNRVLLMKDMKGNWIFPKGKIEKGEALLETAVREIEEEVGLTDLRCISELAPTMYWYFRKKSIKKTVHYFLLESKMLQKPIVQEEEGITEAKWVTWDEAKNIIGYPKTNLPLLEEVATFLTI